MLVLPTASIRGEKQYEQSNHLGNVLTVVSDYKLGIDIDADDIAESYDAAIVSASD